MLLDTVILIICGIIFVGAVGFNILFWMNFLLNYKLRIYMIKHAIEERFKRDLENRDKGYQ